MGCVHRFAHLSSSYVWNQTKLICAVGGGGGVGIQGVQLAKAMDLKVIVVDTSTAKRELSLKMGADVFLDFREVEDVAAEIRGVADGIGAHGVFVVASQGYKDAIRYLGSRAGGKIMCVGIRKLFDPDTDENVLLKDLSTIEHGRDGR